MIVIAGGGLAAQRCCERLRREGWDGRIAIVCDEPHAPYDRPPLSKEFLKHGGEAPRLRPAGWHDDNGVELLLGERAARLRPDRRALELESGAVLPYERLLLATGAAPRMLGGCDGFTNVHVLRTLADAERLRRRLRPGARIAVIGAGFVGQEVASTARSLGAEVTLIEALPAPLGHILGPRVGGWFADLHRGEGVDVRTGAGFSRIAGTGERAERIELSDGTDIACDEIVVAVGVAPATGWLAGTPLQPGRETAGAGTTAPTAVAGSPIEIEHGGRTAVPDVFAAGDCTGGQHWEAAAQQGAAAALGMLGKEPPAAAPSSFWSELYGTRLNFLGDARGADTATIDGDPGAREFAAIYRRRGAPVAGLLVGRPRELPALRRLLHPHTRKEAA